MELKLAEVRKGEVSTHDSQKSEVRRTQKAIRTLEYKLDRVSHETHYHKIFRNTERSLKRHILSYYFISCVRSTSCPGLDLLQ